MNRVNGSIGTGTAGLGIGRAGRVFNAVVRVVIQREVTTFIGPAIVRATGDKSVRAVGSALGVRDFGFRGSAALLPHPVSDVVKTGAG